MKVSNAPLEQNELHQATYEVITSILFSIYDT